MKTLTKLTFALVSILAISQTAFAAGGRTVDATITKIFASSNGDTLITLSSDALVGGGTCDGTAAGATFSVPASAGNAKSGLATILTARALEANVQFDIGECDGVPYPIVGNVILK